MKQQQDEFVDNLIQTIKNPTRALIFYQLARKPDSSATEIAKDLGEDVDVVYYHLKLLKKAGLISKPRVVVCGNYVCKYYSLRPGFKEKFQQSLGQYKEKWKELSLDEFREMLIARFTVFQSILASSVRKLEKVDSKTIEKIRDAKNIQSKIIFCSKERYNELLSRLGELAKNKFSETFDPVAKEYVIAIMAIPKLSVNAN